MSRLPFDPAKMAVARKGASGNAPAGGTGPASGTASSPAAAAASAAAGAMSVSQLAAVIDEAVKDHIARPLRVVGEVSNFTDRTHWYFSMKDAGATISCVMFQFSAKKAGFTPAVGSEVVVTGFVDYYAPQGRISLRVEKIEPVGAGALELEFRRLCEELRGLGYFAPERKRPLPAFAARIAVVTSRTGAALQDVIDTCRRRSPHIEVCLIDVLVQGAAAAPAVAAAVEWVSANAARLEIDTLIVTRGGGSMEDLWAFNDRRVAEAIVRCSIPVAAAIGHETDTTIAELVADVRCATPTQAAMRATPDAAAVREQIDVARRRLSAGLLGTVTRSRQRLVSEARALGSAVRGAVSGRSRRVEQCSARLEQFKPAAVYEKRRAAVMLAGSRLHAAVARRVREAREVDAASAADRLEGSLAQRVRADRERHVSLDRQIELVGPSSVLARGYSVTFGPDGTALRRAEDARPGQVISTKLAEGTVASTVNGLSDLGVRHGEGVVAAKRRRGPVKDDPNQAKLF